MDLLLYWNMINDTNNNNTGVSMKLKPYSKEGFLRLRALSLSDTNDILYGNAEGKTRRRRVSYRAKYKGNFDGGGVGTGRSTRQ